MKVVHNTLASFFHINSYLQSPMLMDLEDTIGVLYSQLLSTFLTHFHTMTPFNAPGKQAF